MPKFCLDIRSDLCLEDNIELVRHWFQYSNYVSTACFPQQLLWLSYIIISCCCWPMSHDGCVFHFLLLNSMVTFLNLVNNVSFHWFLWSLLSYIISCFYWYFLLWWVQSIGIDHRLNKNPKVQHKAPLIWQHLWVWLLSHSWYFRKMSIIPISSFSFPWLWNNCLKYRSLFHNWLLMEHLKY